MTIVCEKDSTFVYVRVSGVIAQIANNIHRIDRKNSNTLSFCLYISSVSFLLFLIARVSECACSRVTRLCFRIVWLCVCVRRTREGVNIIINNVI